MAINRTGRRLASEALHHAGISAFHGVHELHRAHKVPEMARGLTDKEIAYIKRLHDEQRKLAEKISMMRRRTQ